MVHGLNVVALECELRKMVVVGHGRETCCDEIGSEGFK